MNSSFWTIKKGAGPVIAVANHHGYTLHPEVARLMALDVATRLREEDLWVANSYSCDIRHMLQMRNFCGQKGLC